MKETRTYITEQMIMNYRKRKRLDRLIRRAKLINKIRGARIPVGGDGKVLVPF